MSVIAAICQKETIMLSKIYSRLLMFLKESNMEHSLKYHNSLLTKKETLDHWFLNFLVHKNKAKKFIKNKINHDRTKFF